MRFRPCIDIHNGCVKQIVGSTLEGSNATENFKSLEGSDYYADLYKKNGLYGGHIILLNAQGTEEYEADKNEAEKALSTFYEGLQIGGGITDRNASEYLSLGASHIIVTSYVFKDGKINYDNLRKLNAEVGKEKIVLDLSCRKKNGKYYIVTDRWKKFTDVEFNKSTIENLKNYCCELLVHAVDIEGKRNGIDLELVDILSESSLPATYAGGISSLNDLSLIKMHGKGRVDFTIGSALDIFGGNLSFKDVCTYSLSEEKL